MIFLPTVFFHSVKLVRLNKKGWAGALSISLAQKSVLWEPYTQDNRSIRSQDVLCNLKGYNMLVVGGHLKLETASWGEGL